MSSVGGPPIDSLLSPAVPPQPLFNSPQTTGRPALQAIQPAQVQPRPPPSKTPAGPPTESIVETMLGAPPPSTTQQLPEPVQAFLPTVPNSGLRLTDAASVSGDGSEFWVTAFGFHGAAMVPAVLQELRPSGGDFMQHQLGAGSWMHVQLRTRTDQMETLAKNGRVLHGCMLGVVEGKVGPSSQSLDLNVPTAPSAVPLKLNPSRGAEYTVLSKASTGIARRDTGGSDLNRLFTKLCEYVFGW